MDNFAELEGGKHKLFFSFEDFKKLRDSGILSKETSVELIEGEIFHRLEIVSGELKKAEKIAGVFRQAFGKKAIVKVRPSIRLHEIQCLKPSIAILKPSTANSEKDIFEKEETLFVIELTNNKFNYTENPRSRHYGMFEYPEVWFINTDLKLIEVCTRPNHGYSHCRSYLRHNICQSETEPELQIAASEILG